MNKVINITSNDIKQAIDDLVNEKEMLQDKVYKLENIIEENKELLEKIYKVLPATYNQLLIEIKLILDKENKDV